MDFQKIVHDMAQASREMHIPFFIGLIGSLKLTFKIKDKDDLGDLGDAAGDNIPPKKILNLLRSSGSEYFGCL